MQVIAAFQKKNISIIHLFGLVTNYSASPQQRGESDGCQIPLREDMHLITKGRGGGGREHVGVIVSKIATSAAVQRLKLNTFNFPHPLTIISTQWSSVVVPLSALMHDIFSVGQLNI